MIRVDARQVDETVILELRRDGKLLLATSDTAEAVAFLEGLGVQDPAPLVRGARQWGAVEIHQEARPPPRPLPCPFDPARRPNAVRVRDLIASGRRLEVHCNAWFRTFDPGRLPAPTRPAGSWGCPFH